MVRLIIILFLACILGACDNGSAVVDPGDGSADPDTTTEPGVEPPLWEFYSQVPRRSSAIARVGYQRVETTRNFVPHLVGMEMAVLPEGDVLVSTGFVSGPNSGDSLSLWRVASTGIVSWQRKFPIRSHSDVRVSGSEDGFLLVGPDFDHSTDDFLAVATGADGIVRWQVPFSGRIHEAWIASDGGALLRSGARLARISSIGSKAWEKAFDDFRANVAVETANGGFVLFGSNGPDGETAVALALDSGGGTQWEWRPDIADDVEPIRRAWILPDSSILAVGTSDVANLTANGKLAWLRNPPEWDESLETFNVYPLLHAQLTTQGRISLLWGWESTVGFEPWLREFILDEEGSMRESHVSDITPPCV